MDLNQQFKILLNKFHAGYYDEVIAKANNLLKLNSLNVSLYNLIGSCYLQSSNNLKAIETFKTALRLFPNNLPLMNNIANAYKKEFDFKSAEETYKLLLNKKPDYLNGLVNYANLKLNMNHIDQSFKLYEKILSNDPKNYLIYFNKATLLHATGKFKETKIYAQKCLDLQPDFTLADALISTVTKYTINDPHFGKLKQKANNTNLSPQNKIPLHFALAKANFDINQFKDFIFHTKLGNKKKRETINYDLNKDLEKFASIKTFFDKINFEDSEIKINKKKVIFVLGMPRSGTSLVEQIISSHSAVFGAGELPFLQHGILKDLKILDDDKDNVKDILQNANKIAENYLEQISTLCSNEKIVLDKSPLNFIFIGFIRIFFPNAKVIHIKRNSKDTCFSCYKSLFNNGMHFTYNQKELAAFYNGYADLMSFWNNKISNFIHNIQYEELIDYPEKNIKELLDFCDLEFEQNCLEFHNNKAPVRTVSALQVREKIYKKSLNSHKMFKSDFSDIFNNLLVE